MASQSNKSSDGMFQVLNSFDFINTFPGMEPGTTGIVSNEKRNLDRLKARIDRFVEEHLNLVLAIKDYFYNEMVIYGLKRTFKLPFKRTDKVQMEKLFDQFFIEHENSVRLICTYFFDDLKPFLVKNEYLNYALQCNEINAFLNRSSSEVLIRLLKFKGAELITARLYPASLLPDENENQAPAPTPNQFNFNPLIAYIFVLCILFGWKIFSIVFYSFIALLLFIFYVFILMR